MNENIREVMASRIQSEELTIQRMGKPSERMPILCVASIKGPDKDLPTQSRMYDRVIGDIVLIVEVYKRMVLDRAIKSCGPDGQKQAKENDEALAFSIHCTDLL